MTATGGHTWFAAVSSADRSELRLADSVKGANSFPSGIPYPLLVVAAEEFRVSPRRYLLPPYFLHNRRGIMDRQKLKELVHYVCHKVRDPSKLGKTKLNKVLFYADFQTYLDTGTSMTGETYVKFQHGPVSKHIQEIIAELESEGAIATRETKHHGYRKKEYVALEEPELSQFSADEISITDGVIDDVCREHTAASISEFSHNHIWEAAEIGEEIPYEAALVYMLGEIEPDDMAWAKEEVERRVDLDSERA